MLCHLVLLALTNSSFKIDCEVKTLSYHPVAGRANAYGICLWTDHVGYAFNTQGVNTARITDAGRVVFIEPVKGGFCLNQGIYSEHGTLRGELPLVPMGVNSKAQAGGIIKSGNYLSVAAVGGPDGKVLKVGPAITEKDIDGFENQAGVASKCWDVDEKGNYILTAFVSSDRQSLPMLVPMIGHGDKFERLKLPASEVDAYPLKFAFDGSIVGSAYSAPTIMATGWGVGTHGILQSEGVIWKGGKPKIVALGALGVPKSNEVGPKVAIFDSSGDKVLGCAVFYDRETEQPTRSLMLVWQGGKCRKASDVIAGPGVEVTGLLGFTSENTFAALGMKGGKDVLVICKIVKP